MARHKTEFGKKPWLYLTFDEMRDLACVSGLPTKELRAILLLITDEVPVWSDMKRGLVVKLTTGHDLLALAQFQREYVLVRKVIGPLPEEYVEELFPASEED